MLSSGFGVLGGVGGGGFEHGEDDVASASGEADDGGVVFLAFGPFSLVVGLGVWVVLGGDERSDEHGVFEPVVAGA